MTKNTVDQPGMVCSACIKQRGKEIVADPAVKVLTAGLGLAAVYVIPVLFVSILVVVFDDRGSRIGENGMSPGAWVIIAFFVGLSVLIMLDRINVQSVKSEGRSRWAESVAQLTRSLGRSAVSGRGTDQVGDFYVYVHYSMVHSAIVYVGKGTFGRDQSSSRTVSEHERLLRENKIVVHRVLDDVNEKVAFEHESFLIGLLSRGAAKGSLFNIQGGSRVAKDWAAELDRKRTSEPY